MPYKLFLGDSGTGFPDKTPLTGGYRPVIFCSVENGTFRPATVEAKNIAVKIKKADNLMIGLIF